jgi:hypothetical protein
MVARNAYKTGYKIHQNDHNFLMLGAEETIEHWDKRPSRPVIVRGDQKTAHGFSAMVSRGWLYLFAEPRRL